MLTLFYASSLTILALILSFLTGRQRFKTETNLGLGDDFGMLQITRAHGNLIENALFFLILMFLLETVAEVSSVSLMVCLLYTSPSPRDKRQSRMPSSA